MLMYNLIINIKTTADGCDFSGNCLAHVPLKFLYKFFIEEPITDLEIKSSVFTVPS